MAIRKIPAAQGRDYRIVISLSPFGKSALVIIDKVQRANPAGREEDPVAWKSGTALYEP